MTLCATVAAAYARLDEAAWIEHAGPGLVRRARKDLANEAPPHLARDTGTELIVGFDDQQIRFDERGPAAARCSCPATGMCRHVITVGLWLAAAAEPTTGKSTAGNANEPAVGETAPSASPACSTRRPGRAAQQRAITRRQLRSSTGSLLGEIVRAGTAHTSVTAVAQVTAAAIAAQAADHYRLALALRRISDHLQRILDRSAGAGESHVARELATTFALLTALDSAGEDPELLGQARGRYRDRGRLNLVGVGSYPWSAASGYRGLTTMFISPSTSQFHSVAQVRPATVDGFDALSRYSSNAPIWPGLTSASAASGSAIELSGAKSNADGRLSVSQDVRASVEPLSSAQIRDVVRPITSWAALADLDTKPGVLDPPTALSDWVVLAPTRVLAAELDEVTQQTSIRLLDDHGNELVAALTYSDMTAHAITRLRGLAAQWEPGSLLVGRIERGPKPTVLPCSIVWPSRSSGDRPVDDLHFVSCAQAAGTSVLPSTGRFMTDTAAQSDPVPHVTCLLHWLEQVVERGVAGPRAAVTRAELSQRIDQLRRVGYRVFPTMPTTGDAAIEVLQIYVVAEQVRRAARM